MSWIYLYSLSSQFDQGSRLFTRLICTYTHSHLYTGGSENPRNTCHIVIDAPTQRWHSIRSNWGLSILCKNTSSWRLLSLQGNWIAEISSVKSCRFILKNDSMILKNDQNVTGPICVIWGERGCIYGRDLVGTEARSYCKLINKAAAEEICMNAADNISSFKEMQRMREGFWLVLSD